MPNRNRENFPDAGGSPKENNVDKAKQRGPIQSSQIALFQRRTKLVLKLFWLITKDDAFTFVGPNTVFGLCGAFAGPIFTTPAAGGFRNDPSTILWRLSLVVIFNWSNLLVFDLANQRLPLSILEDSVNKPWRPAPGGLMTSDDIRRSMLVVIPVVWALSFCLGVATETSFLFVLTWLYNDLMGGDESWILRNCIIAAAFGLYNLGSLRVATGAYSFDSEPSESNSKVTLTAITWLLVVSGVILTTMQVQDLKDQSGDRRRGRKTAPLVLGDRAARWTVAIPVACWSVVCLRFWGGPGATGVPGLGVLVLGLAVALLCLTRRGGASDRLTWQLWTAWTAVIYTLPCCNGNHQLTARS